MPEPISDGLQKTGAVLPRPQVFGGDFFVVLATLVGLVVFAGFAPSFYLRATDRGVLPALYVWHGAVFTAWFALYWVQSVLIRTGSVGRHRMLGLVSVLLVPPLLIMGMAAGLDALRRGITVLDWPPATFFFMSASDMAGFLVLIGAGLALRRKAETHKRLMALASISLVLPAAGRIADGLGIGPAGAALQLGLVGLIVVHDAVTRRALHPATVFGGGLILAKLAGIPTIGTSAAWIGLVSLL